MIETHKFYFLPAYSFLLKLGTGKVPGVPTCSSVVALRSDIPPGGSRAAKIVNGDPPLTNLFLPKDYSD